MFSDWRCLTRKDVKENSLKVSRKKESRKMKSIKYSEDERKRIDDELKKHEGKSKRINKGHEVLD